jgi:anaerobic ribonucleoside-triphosphate reductase activating protein
MDISNGPGIRVSIFMQGCNFDCKNCFNPETHDFSGGKEFTFQTIDTILELCNYDYIKGLSILGGEPLDPINIYGTTMLVKKFKERFPEKDVWIWTGFSFSDYVINKDIALYADVIVDGRFKEDLYNPHLKWKGSSNQRVIDVKQTMKNYTSEFDFGTHIFKEDYISIIE